MAFSYGKDYDIIGKEIAFKVPPSGILKIYRETPTDRLVEWNEGSVLLSSDMTLSQVQQLHIIEEQQLWSLENSIVLNENDVWEGRFTRIGNVADPINDQDVVSKKYMENVQGGFVQANTALKDEATRQANIATTKASEASNSATSASGSATLAQRWAEASNSPDNTTSKSAKTWATEAGVSATKAGTSEANAKASETNAKSSETNAANSATSASGSASTATAQATLATEKANVATTKASEASTSAINAKASETNAKTSETNAANSALIAEQYASAFKLKIVVVSTRVRGDDEPTYGLTS